MPRTILHCDLNNFFASVELLDKPELRDKPVAVGGSVEKRHGIILAKNDVAKKYSVQTAEPLWQAKQKCADLIILPPHYDKYMKYSKLSREILLDYTDMVEPFSIDESWLDVTGSQRLFGTGEQIAHKIRQRHIDELGLTVSVGVSFNKIFAKLASDLKKPNAVTCIREDNYKQIVYPLPVRALMGIGGSTENRLKSVGINTLGELADTDIRVVRNLLGVCGEKLWYCVNAMDNSPVISKELMPAQKSVSRSITPPEDISDFETAKEYIFYLSEDVYSQMLKMQVYSYSLSVEIRENSLERHSFRKMLRYPLKTSSEIACEALKLLKDNYSKKLALRSIGVCVGDFECCDEPLQTDLFFDCQKQLKHEKLEKKVNELRGKYGSRIIKRALLLNKDMPDEISHSTPCSFRAT